MIFLFAAAILCFTIQNITFKKFNLSYMKNTANYFIFNALYFVLICGIYVVVGIDPSLFNLASVGLALLFATSFISAIFFYMKAMEHGPLGMSFLFFSSGMLLPIIFGVVVLSEPVLVHNLVGLVLLFIAFVVSVYGKGEGKMNKTWLMYILLSAVTNGVIGIAIKMSRMVISEYALIEFLFLGFGQAAIISLIIGVIITLKYKMPLAHFSSAMFVIVVIATAISTAFGNYLMVRLSFVVSAMVQFPVMSGSLVITSIISSRLVYKEQITKKHVAAIVVGLAAIVLLSL